MGIGAQIKASVKSILPQVFNDEDLNTKVTWRKFSESTFDATAGYNVDTYKNYVIYGLKVEHMQGIGSGKGGYLPGMDATGIEYGMVSFLFRTADLPSGRSIRDRILDGDTVYRIKNFYPIMDLITKVDVEGIT